MIEPNVSGSTRSVEPPAIVRVPPHAQGGFRERGPEAEYNSRRLVPSSLGASTRPRTTQVHPHTSAQSPKPPPTPPHPTNMPRLILNLLSCHHPCCAAPGARGGQKEQERFSRRMDEPVSSTTTLFLPLSPPTFLAQNQPNSGPSPYMAAEDGCAGHHHLAPLHPPPI